MQALHDVVQAGYVRYIGMSSCWAYQCQYSFTPFVFNKMLTVSLTVHAMQSKLYRMQFSGTY